MKKGVKRTLLGRYIVLDPRVCHGKPTFRGTRVLVSDVLQMVTDGMAWEAIIEEWHNSISKDAIGEAVKLPSAINGGASICQSSKSKARTLSPA